MNVTDEDGDTPLYVVENVETARYLVERGAVVDRRNGEGQTVRAHPSHTRALVGLCGGCGC